MLQNTKKIISVTTEIKFFRPDQTIISNKDEGSKEGIEMSRVYSSGEPNPICYQKKASISCDEGRSKVSMPDHTKNIFSATPEDRFCLPKLL